MVTIATAGMIVVVSKHNEGIVTIIALVLTVVGVGLSLNDYGELCGYIEEKENGTKMQ